MASYPTPAALKSAASSGTARVTAKSGLVLRSAPSTSATRVTAIPYGSTVKLLAVSAATGWKAVSYGVNYGYVSSAYLGSGASAASLAVASKSTPSTATGGSAEIRAIAPAPSSAASAATATTINNSSMTDKTKKILIGSAIVVGVGIAGYFAYKAFKKPQQALSGIGGRRKKRGGAKLAPLRIKA